jgi:hypothetical protein
MITCVPVRYLILGIQLMFMPSVRHGDMDGVVGLIFIVSLWDIKTLAFRRLLQ